MQFRGIVVPLHSFIRIFEVENVGAGSIGQAIIRRVSAGKHIVLADYSLEHAEQAAKTLENAGFEYSTIKCNLGGGLSDDRHGAGSLILQ